MAAAGGRGSADRRRSIALHAGVVALAGVAARAHRLLKPRSPLLAEAILPIGTAAGWWTLARLERRHPFQQSWTEPRDGDLGTDTAFLALTSIPYVLGTVVGGRIGRRWKGRASLGRLPTAVAVPIALAVYELFHTTYHRVGHEWGPAWKLHSVHHSATRLYWLNATRFHLVEIGVESVVDTAMATFFGLQPHQDVARALCRAVYGQLQHSNIAVDSGPLNRVFATPDLHRWHHSEIYDEGDTNYGAVLSVWDQLLGSYFWPGRQLDSQIGVGRMPHFPTRWWPLQRVPVDWERIKADNAETWIDAPRTAAV